MNTEPYALITSCGAEIYSDDRKMKYIARLNVSFVGMEQVSYVVTCYVKDKTMWERTTHQRVFTSMEAFYENIENSPGFTKATMEINENRGKA